MLLTLGSHSLTYSHIILFNIKYTGTFNIYSINVDHRMLGYESISD